MAYDRYDTRDERSRWSSDRERDRDWNRERGQSGHDERGFFERAGDQISSWFGDDDSERQHRDDPMSDEREDRSSRGFGGGQRGRGEHQRDQTWSSGDFGGDRDRDFNRGGGYR